MGLLIQVQDKFQTLPFKDSGRQQFQRFKANEKFKLIKEIFNEEFNVQTLIDAHVVYDHFMPHTSKKYEIIESIKKHETKLIINMLSLYGSFRKYIEPINLIADYYGEKYAMYIAFSFHHIGWLILPAIVGTALFFYHIYLGVRYREDGENYFMSYLRNVDTPINFFYIVFISFWSTFYVESWKRKQAAIQHLWGLNEKAEQIKQNIKLAQENTQRVYDEDQGQVVEQVMGGRKCMINCTNFFILIMFSSLAIVASTSTIALQSAIEFESKLDA